MNKIAKISVAFMATLALTGCSQKSNEKKSNSEKSGKASVVVHNKKPTKMGHLSSNDLSPQKTVAVVTAYAGSRYSGSWSDALNNTKSNGLQVDLKNQENYSYMKDGSGVAYLVSGDAAYTLKQVNGENVYYLYMDKKELGSVTMKQMVDYLNKRDSDSLVNNLANGAKIVDQRSDSDDSDSADSNGSSKKSNIPADGGLFDIPSEYQGTWYTYSTDSNKLTTIILSQHKISDGKYATELHKVDKSAGDYVEKYQTSKSYGNETKDWGRVGFMNVEGIKFMNVRGWMQSAGDGEYYGPHTEKGQSVLVLAYGAGPWVDSVAWKTPQLAQQYKHKKFADLHYQDDE